MLPAHTKELLTAAVDGELSSAERRMVEKLLRDSHEAREFHARITRDSARIRNLPPALPGDDLARGILNIIADRAITPTPLPMPRRHRFDASRTLPWVAMATAACVVLLVSVSAFIYLDANQRHAARHQAQAEQGRPQPGLIAKTSLRPDNGSTVNADPATPEQKTPEESDDMPALAKVEPRSPEPEALPAPRVVGPDRVIATPSFPENVPFKVVEVALPWIMLPLHDLEQAYPSKTTRDALKKSEVSRIVLFCKDSSRAAEIVQSALKARGHQVLIDAAAADRIRKKQKGDLVVYTESFTAEEIAQLLEQLGADDRKLEKRKAGEGQFDKFMLAPFHPADLAELARLLGVPANQIKLPRPKVSAPIDPRGRSLENITANQLVQNLPRSASRGNEKMSVVLADANTFVPQNSREVKAFLEKRGERKPGAVPLMLVLRTLN